MSDMDEPPGHRRKRNLPFPYNQDVSGVLRNLRRITPMGRRRLANSPETAAFLAAGMRLLHRHFGPGGRQRVNSELLLLGPLSQRRVAEEFHRNPPPFVRNGNGGSMLRDRWEPHSNFIVDLLNFALWRENYRPEYRKQRKANIERLVRGPDFANAVHEVAHRHAAEGVDLPQVRLSLALMAAAEGDDEVRRIISAVYGDYLGSWKQLYGTVIRARRLRLREGLTRDDLANALSAANDGMTLRAIGDPASGVIDHDNNRSLMGLVALAVIYAFLEPDEDASGLTLEQAVAARFDRRL
ncbi:hypothetical protein [Streptomyces meridianus]|uniref:Uncharacterized protein n=1 Tax=Streptomyces meridianus TaxID=2938945 RepID=A0ABT0X9N4_9ACTN|nr:hypothetical protein [Streptomyces meridianus]MCM2579050.1 hypothetical protein [Streptomyces meridianus]